MCGPSIDACRGVCVQKVISEKGAVSLCRCFKSATFPLCNGAHVSHNKETGDNAGPLVLKKLGGGAAPPPPEKAVVDGDLRVRCNGSGYLFGD